MYGFLLRVLVIEDDPTSRTLPGTLLQAYGCEVLVADTEGDALRFVNGRRPDFALVDLNLHGDPEAGARILRAIRAFPEGVGGSCPSRVVGKSSSNWWSRSGREQPRPRPNPDSPTARMLT
jgi:CheY-like chemotaxis protein